ncbi:PAS domain S-box protein [Methanocella sp. MCL-LM]|uniref:sensor histidine kinase n=1 Tax=Methanocella sp. MCL-LM TaxID=3412035 RepID=UPI003C74FC6B
MALAGREGLEKYRAVFEAASDGIALQYPGTWEIVDVNPAMCRMYGYSKEEIMHINPALLFSGEDPLAMEKAGARLQAAMSGHPQLFDWHARHRDGHTFWIQVSLKLMQIGPQAYVLSLVRDITDRKRIEQELHDSKISLEQAQQLAQLGTWRWDAINDVVTGSSEASRILGVDQPITQGEFIEIIHPEDRTRVAKAIRKAGESDVPFSQEFRFLRSDGSVLWVHSVGKTVFEDGRPLYSFGTIQDITDRKRFEQELQESETILAQAQQLAHLGSWRWDVQRDVLKMSDEGYRIMGLKPGEIGLNYSRFLGFIHPDDRGEMEKAITATVNEGLMYRQVHRLVRLDRSVRWIQCEGKMISTEDQPAVMLGTMQDITEIKNAERAVEDARAQAELFLDLMGHDINNMNQVALGYLEMALNKLHRGEQIGPADVVLVEKPLETLESSSNLIRNVKKLQRARSENMATQAMDIGEVLTWVKDRALHAPGRDITIDYRPAYGFRVMANELIWDMFSNIVTNAVKHSDPKKPLHVRIAVDRVFEAKQEYYRVSVEDNGPGIPDDTKRQIFSRLQHGRGRPRSGGLGLYLVSTLASQFHGRVWVEDRVPGDHTRGSRFVVMLPALRAEDANSDAEARA